MIKNWKVLLLNIVLSFMLFLFLGGLTDIISVIILIVACYIFELIIEKVLYRFYGRDIRKFR